MNIPATGEYVSTILRLHDPAKAEVLGIALMSLCGQRYPYLAPVIVLQNFSDVDEGIVRRIAEQFPWPAEARAPAIVNVRGLPPGDHRSKLMNAGLDAADGAYVGFLDYDDYLYPNAYSLLIARMRRTGVNAVFGGILRADVDPRVPYGGCVCKQPFRKSRPKYDFFDENIYPLHSFLLRREAIGDIRVPEQISTLEDYYLLLSVLKDHDWDDALFDTQPIADYVFWTDGSNTTATANANCTKGQAWHEARVLVANVKAGLEVKTPLPSFLAISRCAGLTSHGGTPNLTAPIANALSQFLPYSIWLRRLSGGFCTFQWDGYEAVFQGVVEMLKPATQPLAGLLFLSRPSLLRPSYKYLSCLSYFEPVDDGKSRAFAFSGRAPLIAEDMRKGRDNVVMFIMTNNKRLFHAEGIAALVEGHFHVKKRAPAPRCSSDRDQQAPAPRCSSDRGQQAPASIPAKVQPELGKIDAQAPAPSEVAASPAEPE